MSGGVGEWGSGDAAPCAGRASSGLRPPRGPRRIRPATRPGFALVSRVLVVAFLLVAGGCGLPRWPVRGVVTSPYGMRFVGWSIELHPGIDISVPDGTPVVAMSGGTVSFAGQKGAYGNVVYLHHHGTTYTVYGHLSELKVRQGEHVDGGQVIGLSGHSGNARGPHLHFEVRRWGEPEDPVPLLGGAPPGRP